MVKFTSSLFVAALIAAPAFAAIRETAFESRELVTDHDIVARDVQDIFTRFVEDMSDVEMRELQDLESRSFKSFFKGLFKKAKSLVSHILRREDMEDDLLARDYDELDARDLDEFFERYISELEERSPNIMSFPKEGMHKVKSIAHAGHHEDSTEPAPVTREFFDDEELTEREIDEDEVLARAVEWFDELD